jgi:hypothetical protein
MLRVEPSGMSCQPTPKVCAGRGALIRGDAPGPAPSTQPSSPSGCQPRSSPTTRTQRSSRIRPANDRETSRNDGDGWSIESAGQEPNSGIAAGSDVGPENTQTRVQIPLGLPGNAQVRTPDPLGAVEAVGTRPAFVPRSLRTRRDIRTRSTHWLRPLVGGSVASRRPTWTSTSRSPLKTASA